MNASARLVRQLLRVERVLSRQPLEHLFAFGPDGRLRFRATSLDPSRVLLSEDQTRQLAGAIVTHNHPSGRSLSEMDLEMAMQCDVLQVRAVTRWARYWIDRPRTGWTPFACRAVRTGLHDENAMVLSELQRDIQARKITRADADLLYDHVLWKRMAERGLLQYGLDFWHGGTAR